MFTSSLRKMISKGKFKRWRRGNFKPHYGKLTIFIWAIAIFLFLGVFIFFMVLKANPFNLFGSLPEVSDLENPEMKIASELYSSDSMLIGKYYQEEVPFLNNWQKIYIVFVLLKIKEL